MPKANLDFRQRNCTPNLGQFLLGIEGLADLDAELAALPPRHRGRGVQELTGQQDGVMRTALELHGDLLVSHGDARGSSVARVLV